MTSHAQLHQGLCNGDLVIEMEPRVQMNHSCLPIHEGYKLQETNIT